MQLKIEIHAKTVLKENTKTKAMKILNFDLSDSIYNRVLGSGAKSLTSKS